MKTQLYNLGIGSYFSYNGFSEIYVIINYYLIEDERDILSFVDAHVDAYVEAISCLGYIEIFPCSLLVEEKEEIDFLSREELVRGFFFCEEK